MGDRGIIYLVDTDTPEKGIYLYTHYHGAKWHQMLIDEVCSDQARSRWDDSAYLQRILISNLFYDIHGSEIGGGVSTTLILPDHPITICDTYNRVIARAEVQHEYDYIFWYEVQTFYSLWLENQS